MGRKYCLVFFFTNDLQLIILLLVLITSNILFFFILKFIKQDFVCVLFIARDSIPLD